MIRFVFLALMLFSAQAGISQSIDPIHWTHTIESTEDNNTYVLVSKAKIDGDWCLYSQHTESGGPIPTTFTYDDSVELVGETEEVSPAITKYSELFELNTIKFKKSAVFRQTFTSSEEKPSISGTVQFMTCDGLRCLPPRKVKFSATL